MKVSSSVLVVWITTLKKNLVHAELCTFCADGSTEPGPGFGDAEWRAPAVVVDSEGPRIPSCSEYANVAGDSFLAFETQADSNGCKAVQLIAYLHCGCATEPEPPSGSCPPFACDYSSSVFDPFQFADSDSFWTCGSAYAVNLYPSDTSCTDLAVYGKNCCVPSCTFCADNSTEPGLGFGDELVFNVNTTCETYAEQASEAFFNTLFSESDCKAIQQINFFRCGCATEPEPSATACSSDTFACDFEDLRDPFQSVTELDSMTCAGLYVQSLHPSLDCAYIEEHSPECACVKKCNFITFWLQILLGWLPFFHFCDL